MKKTEPQRIVFSACPACGRKVYEGDKIILLQYMIGVPPGHPPMYSMPKMTCLKCGVEYFPPKILEQIKKNLEQGPSRIVIPDGMRVN